jgi:cob(I)alamin adenosyltransferase
MTDNNRTGNDTTDIAMNDNSTIDGSLTDNSMNDNDPTDNNTTDGSPTETDNSLSDNSSPEDDARQEKHKAKQQRLKEKVDASIARANQDKGLLLVVTGDGKGKSTAGFGVVARAVGHGLKAAVCQFIKGTWECGERNLLAGHGVEFSVMGTGFTWDTQNRATDIEAAEAVWADALRFLQDDSINVILLDELTYMVAYDYISLDRVVTALQNRPPMQHVVITGRGCPRELVEMADTVSKVQSVKHAYEAGVRVQKGIDW